MARKPSSETSFELHDPAIAEEARQLARAAVEEVRHGDRDEAQFVINEARQLDREAVDEVLKEKEDGKASG